jgi:superfamily II DNA helicase RecQ
MLFRVLTLPFDPVLEGFPDEVVEEFCLNKQVHKLESQFFIKEGQPYWSVAIHYDIVLKKDQKTRDLDERQKLLYERLREWRKTTAHEDGIPVYLIATNQHLVEIIRRKPQTLDGLKPIKGFGGSRMGRYGARILNIVKAFYEEHKEKTETPAPESPETPY